METHLISSKIRDLIKYHSKDINKIIFDLILLILQDDIEFYIIYNLVISCISNVLKILAIYHRYLIGIII
ncbi:hypothetical protein BpHYR1_012292 [Brachionus plicatilis]|uniref:Uncharacterized protein n=1 Tax=Brachionus plicatilis TaxID=10195 RepID=A0A3M7Q1N4_BRAPC|nr:hypothetical protein BpHYR1_012292 [Brachionus plicatilis]